MTHINRNFTLGEYLINKIVQPFIIILSGASEDTPKKEEEKDTELLPDVLSEDTPKTGNIKKVIYLFMI